MLRYGNPTIVSFFFSKYMGRYFFCQSEGETDKLLLKREPFWTGNLVKGWMLRLTAEWLGNELELCINFKR